MLQIVWSRSALDDLERISNYISARNEAAADALRERIELSILPAASYPHAFRTGRLRNTREIVAHPNYIVVYRVLPSCLRILAVLHARQKYPPEDPS